MSYNYWKKYGSQDVGRGEGYYVDYSLPNAPVATQPQDGSSATPNPTIEPVKTDINPVAPSHHPYLKIHPYAGTWITPSQVSQRFATHGKDSVINVANMYPTVEPENEIDRVPWIVQFPSGELARIPMSVKYAQNHFRMDGPQSLPTTNPHSLDERYW